MVCDHSGNHGYTPVFVFFRKVQTESATGSTSSNKVRTALTINVEAIDFDTQACVLRVKGRNIEENQYVKVSYVTLTDILKSVTFLMPGKHMPSFVHIVPEQFVVPEIYSDTTLA